MLTAAVERGAFGGDTLAFKGMGEQQPRKSPGDIVITLRERKHSVFRRAGRDLHTDINLSLKEALLGFERTIQHLDKHTVVIRVAGVTKHLALIRVRGEGMPHRGDPTIFGDLYVTCRLVMPLEARFSESQL